ncbi:MAG: hypothetical protein D6775_03830 [Caldilineae bacterium]|nr:MAG: hypothetical protein D6775_03830 [Caldilineae bacterium]
MNASSLSSRLSRPVWRSVTLAQVLLAAITLLAAGLHFVNLGAIGDANTYYTAAVKSMLQSWHNFFFVAAEPGGSVTVDKPPLGLWVEALFALVFGVHGWSVALPNILAGVLSVPLLYALVKRHLGELAGLVAALALTLTPVFLATNRNNTMDGLLTFILLLAAWAFLRATETGRLRWVLLGGLLVGLGFETKMLQAFLPLPAFYALYFFGAKRGWKTKLAHLALATVVILVVGLAWPLAVDLTPPENRPYVGSSTNNTVMELIVGHNGLSRLFNPRARNAGLTPSGNRPGPGRPMPPAGQGRPSGPPPAGRFGDGPNVSPDGPRGPQAGGVPFANETGTPGVLRFFRSPLAKQMSWLLPFGLLSVGLSLAGARLRLPLEPAHQAVVLWGGWLLTCLVFFSAVEGIFHAYYTIMLAPSLAALVGGGFAWFARRLERPAALAGLSLAAAGTVAFQVFAAHQEGVTAAWLWVAPLLLLLGAVALAWARSRRVGAALVLAALLFIPLVWSGLTVLDASPEVNLPSAYTSQTAQRLGLPGREGADSTALLGYLQAHPPGTKYLVAVPSAQVGAPLVLATGQPVLYMGGFAGSDPVVDAEDLAAMVQSGQLRYVLFGAGRGARPEIQSWLEATCTPVPVNLNARGQALQLYDCQP